MNDAYATILPDLDALFEDGDRRTSLEENVVDIIRAQITEKIKERATNTADKDRITTYINKLPMLSSMAHGEQVTIKTVSEIKCVLENVINNGKMAAAPFT